MFSSLSMDHGGPANALGASLGRGLSSLTLSPVATMIPVQRHIQVQIKPEYPDTNTTNFPDPITGYGYEYHKFPGPDNRIRIIKRIRSDQISTKKASEYFGYPQKNLKPDSGGLRFASETHCPDRRVSRASDWLGSVSSFGLARSIRVRARETDYYVDWS